MTTKEEVIKILETIIDPELYIDIWTLGLIYQVEINDGILQVVMTFTSVACPAGPQLVEEIQLKTKGLPGISETKVEIVFDPPWKPSDELKEMLGIG